jgi:plasmanylethanolamine desaturase
MSVQGLEPLSSRATTPLGCTRHAAGEAAASAAGQKRASSGAGAGDVSGPLHRLLELAAVILFPFLFVSSLLVSYERLQQQEIVWLVLPGLLLGLVCGDLVTGLVHWAADTYCEEETPLIGRSLVKPFREHHLRPNEICEHGIIETVGNTCILAVPVLSLLLWLTTYVNSALPAFASFVAALTVGVTVATNQFHKWAHADVPPMAARLLQRAGIILSHEHHRSHHTAPFEASYAITNGWLNPLLDRTRFFRLLESALHLLGVKPSRRRE